MQYNFAADNDGGGIILCHWGSDLTFTGNIIRHNVSRFCVGVKSHYRKYILQALHKYEVDLVG